MFELGASHNDPNGGRRRHRTSFAAKTILLSLGAIAEIHPAHRVFARSRSSWPLAACLLPCLQNTRSRSHWSTAFRSASTECSGNFDERPILLGRDQGRNAGEHL